MDDEAKVHLFVAQAASVVLFSLLFSLILGSFVLLRYLVMASKVGEILQNQEVQDSEGEVRNEEKIRFRR